MTVIIPSTNDLLRKKSSKASEENFAVLADKLMQACYANLVTSLSACQIGIDASAFIFSKEGHFIFCANPEIVAASIEMTEEFEECPSCIGFTVKVNRPTSVVARYQDINGTEITEKLTESDARQWLHEYDHTNGIVITDRISKLKFNMAKKKYQKFLKRNKI